MNILSLLTPTAAGGGMSSLFDFLSGKSRDNPRTAAFIAVGGVVAQWFGIAPDNLASTLMSMSEALAYMAGIVGR